MNYFEIDRISASFLTSVEWMWRFGSPQPTKESQAMTLGTLIHKAMETDGESMKRLFIPDEEILSSLKPFEKKWVLEGLTHEGYAKIYTSKLVNDFKSGDSGAFEKIGELIDDLKNHYVVKQWFTHLKDNKDKINLLAFPNPLETKTKIEKSFEALNKVDLVKQTQNAIREKIVLWEYEGTDCKSLLDRHDELSNIVIDFKTYSNNIERNIRQYRYLRQMSFYRESVNADKVFIVAIDTDYFKAQTIEISKESMRIAKTGGYEVLSWMNTGDFMTDHQINLLEALGLWKKTFDNRYLGWEELIKYINNNNLK